jgi:AraC-like DNA-binding protein
VSGSPRARIYFDHQRVLYLGPSLAVSSHRHHAVQIFLPLSGRIRLRAGPGARWAEYAGAITASGQPHEADSPVPLLATLWLEPNLEQAHRLVPRSTRAPIAAVEKPALERVVPRLLDCWNGGHDSQRASAVIDEVLEILASAPIPRPTLDPRVAEARRILRSMARTRASFAELAAALSLSPGRLTHLFSAELGMPPRRYRLWLRLLDAVDELAEGASIAQAACGAGFSDAPHLTRTFRRMLGFTPAAARHVAFIPVVAARPSTGAPDESRFVQDAAARPS